MTVIHVTPTMHLRSLWSHDQITQCCFNAGPASETPAQHWNSAGTMCCIPPGVPLETIQGLVHRHGSGSGYKPAAISSGPDARWITPAAPGMYLIYGGRNPDQDVESGSERTSRGCGLPRVARSARFRSRLALRSAHRTTSCPTHSSPRVMSYSDWLWGNQDAFKTTLKGIKTHCLALALSDLIL